jgi:hypothetical protein
VGSSDLSRHALLKLGSLDAASFRLAPRGAEGIKKPSLTVTLAMNRFPSSRFRTISPGFHPVSDGLAGFN